MDAERTFLRDFFRTVTDQPLSPDDPRYVPVWSDPALTPDDPVQLIARGVEFALDNQSVQLLSGFRGTGKTTELRRLRKQLRDSGYICVLCDMDDHVNLSTPIDVSDFLLSVVDAFGLQLQRDGYLDEDPKSAGYIRRFLEWVRSTRVDFDISEFEVGAFRVNLKRDPSFREKLQSAVAGHLGALVDHVRAYIEEIGDELRREREDIEGVVLLVDSVEHIRGTTDNAVDVQASVERLFAGHADKLHLPRVHVVYTIPPWLRVLYGNLSALFGPGGVQVLPAVKVRERDGSAVFRPGVEALRRVVAARGDWRRLLPGDAALDRLILVSGGHLRDLLRLLAEVIRRTDHAPVDDALIDRAIDQLRNEALPIPDDEAVWLGRIASTHEPALAKATELPVFARFLDSHVVLCHRNGTEWYEVHPLIADHICAQAAGIERRRAERAARAAGKGEPA